jgi:serine/threonine protein phosphatase PrpC
LVIGVEVVELVEEKFIGILLEQEAYKQKDYQKALHDTFMAFDPIIDKVKE